MSLTLTDLFARFTQGLTDLLNFVICRSKTPQPLAFLLTKRVERLRNRFLALVAQFRAGTLPTPRPSRAGAPPRPAAEPRPARPATCTRSWNPRSEARKSGRLSAASALSTPTSVTLGRSCPPTSAGQDSPKKPASKSVWCQAACPAQYSSAVDEAGKPGLF